MNTNENPRGIDYDSAPEVRDELVRLEAEVERLEGALTTSEAARKGAERQIEAVSLALPVGEELPPLGDAVRRVVASRDAAEARAVEAKRRAEVAIEEFTRYRNEREPAYRRERDEARALQAQAEKREARIYAAAGGHESVHLKRIEEMNEAHRLRLAAESALQQERARVAANERWMAEVMAAIEGVAVTIPFDAVTGNPAVDVVKTLRAHADAAEARVHKLEADLLLVQSDRDLWKGRYEGIRNANGGTR